MKIQLVRCKCKVGFQGTYVKKDDIFFHVTWINSGGDQWHTIANSPVQYCQFCGRKLEDATLVDYDYKHDLINDIFKCAPASTPA